MKHPLPFTRVTVKLRKAEKDDLWYLFLESYLVIVPGSTKPKRVIEAINRKITTPVWDRHHRARTSADGIITYKPKRDLNGIIICRSQVDKEACIFADKVRELRQREYDNAALFSEQEAAMAEIKDRQNQDYILYFKKESRSRHAKSSNSIYVNWKRVGELMLIFTDNQPWLFRDITTSRIEQFKRFLLNSAPQGANKPGTISRNTASTYFSIFKAGLHQAFIDGYLQIDIAAKVRGIAGEERRREYLTIDELNLLIATPCEHPVLKRAALFSALTSLRHCDIQKLKWGEIQDTTEGSKLNYTQKKTKGVESTPISDQARQLCGERGDDDRLVFEGLMNPSWISRPLKKWIEAAGIKRHITFHCFRHTFNKPNFTNVII